MNDPIDLKLYDKLFALMSPWQQAKPLKPEKAPAQATSGYMRFLSFYDRGNSRQMLLTLEDFFICLTKNCDAGRAGRLTRALGLLRKD